MSFLCIVMANSFGSDETKDDGHALSSRHWKVRMASPQMASLHVTEYFYFDYGELKQYLRKLNSTSW